jgi:mannosyltransferase
MNRRGAYLAAAVTLLLIAVTMPTGWYDAIPHEGLPELPMRGVTLLRLTIAFEALVLVFLAVRNWSFGADHESIAMPSSETDAPGDISSRAALAALVAITALGLMLRSISLGSDLWIDEITPIFDYARLPAAQVIGSYLRSNNHLLNTLLMKVSLAFLGEHEWSVRLPAMLFGVATIPMLYWVARLAMSRLASLGAALLLAFSYHHIFFSQNARGYTGHLFFALLSTGALVRGIQRDAMRYWVLYVVSVVLGFASLITFVFVFAAQILVGAIATVLRHRRNRPAASLARRLSGAYAIAAFLSFQLYATSLPEAYVVISSLYSVHGTTYAAFSLDFIRDVIQGLSAGMVGTDVVFFFLVLGAAGYASLFTANWPLAATLALTLVLAGGLLAARGLTFSPRFFLIGLPLAFLSTMSAAEVVVALARRKFRLGQRSGGWMIVALAICVSAVFAASLPRYYRTPKQPYRAAVAYLERSLRPGDAAVVIYVAESGFRYYVERERVRDPNAYHYVRTTAALDSIMTEKQGGRILLATTLPGILRQYLPDLFRRISECCEVVRVFPGTLGDGDITIWEQRRRK